MLSIMISTECFVEACNRKQFRISLIFRHLLFKETVPFENPLEFITPAYTYYHYIMYGHCNGPKFSFEIT